jgi:GT2 family glycosyltransferase
VLYHWRRGVQSAESFSEVWLEQCVAAAHRAVSDHLAAIGTPAEVGPAPRAPMWNRVTFPIPDPAPPVSIIIPTRDRADLLESCIEGLRSRTSYQPAEILIIDHESVEPETHLLFERLTRSEPRLRILPYHGAYNYAAMNNMAIEQATGEVIALLNNDIDVRGPEWLGEMVSHAVRPGVGIVGAKLLYGDHRVQHAGIVLGPGPSLVHVQRLAEPDSLGYFGQLALTRELSAVTAACLVSRKAVLVEIGGFDAVNLPIAFNDVDLCLRAGDFGYRVVWTPFAELFHLEGASRGSDALPEQQARSRQELQYLYRTWAGVIENDPFHNKNVLFGWHETCVPAPPRLRRLWRGNVAPVAQVDG